MTTVALLANLTTAEHEGRWKLMQQLAPEGIETRLVNPGLSRGELIEALKGVDAVVPWLARVPVDLATDCPDLKLVQLLTAGFDVVDVPGLAELGISVANNGGANAISVSEHAMSLMLSVYRRLTDSWLNTKQGKWRDGIDQLPFRAEINGKTVGIVGFGNIGRQVARRLAGWDVELLYHDVVELMPGRDAELGAVSTPLDELLERSDIVTAHVPLNRSTRGMFGAREFGLMKKTAVFINTCRGPVHNEAALIAALKAGEIAGAGLDVLEQEPTDPANPLLHMDNVVVTPHWAGGTAEGNERALKFAMSNFQRLAEGRKLLSVVEPEAQS
ncbi:MAG: 2-hydroxyacid dehydrogenase [Chloroflexi bacterium]|nr:2-hydroxyacid dehydrogenase [Chloroflexota bacterium]